MGSAELCCGRFGQVVVFGGEAEVLYGLNGLRPRPPQDASYNLSCREGRGRKIYKIKLRDIWTK